MAGSGIVVGGLFMVMDYKFLFSRVEAEVKGDIDRAIQGVDKDGVHFPLGQPVAISLNVLRLS